MSLPSTPPLKAESCRSRSPPTLAARKTVGPVTSAPATHTDPAIFTPSRASAPSETPPATGCCSSWTTAIWCDSSSATILSPPVNSVATAERPALSTQPMREKDWTRASSRSTRSGKVHLVKLTGPRVALPRKSNGPEIEASRKSIRSNPTEPKPPIPTRICRSTLALATFLHPSGSRPLTGSPNSTDTANSRSKSVRSAAVFKRPGEPEANLSTMSSVHPRNKPRGNDAAHMQPCRCRCGTTDVLPRYTSTGRTPSISSPDRGASSACAASPSASPP